MFIVQNYYGKNSKANNFLAHFSLMSQLRRMLKIHWKDSLNYINRNYEENIISDIDDGLLFKNQKKSCDEKIISLTMNIDGATIANSDGYQLWPIKMNPNCLPPAQRYLSQNTIVTNTLLRENKAKNETFIIPIIQRITRSRKFNIHAYV